MCPRFASFFCYGKAEYKTRKYVRMVIYTEERICLWMNCISIGVRPLLTL